MGASDVGLTPTHAGMACLENAVQAEGNQECICDQDAARGHDKPQLPRAWQHAVCTAASSLAKRIVCHRPT